MRSERSFFNKTLFLKNITRFWPIWVIYMLIWFFTLSMNIGMKLSSDSYNYDQYNLLTYQPVYLGHSVGLTITAIFSILTAMALFSYLFFTKSANAVHSLPIRRESLFITNYISGLCFLLIPNLVIFFLTLGIEAVNGKTDLTALLNWLGMTSGGAVFCFSFAVLCAQGTGNIVALPVLYVIFNFLSVGLTTVARTILGLIVYGMSDNFDIGWSVYLSPIYALYSDVRVDLYDYSAANTAVNAVNTMVFSGGWLYAVYAGVGLLLAAASLFIYRKKRVETAGDVISVSLFRPVFKYGVAACAALTFGLLIYALLFYSDNGTQNSWKLLICIIVMSFLGYFAAEMLLAKSFRVIKQHMKGWIVFAAVLAALFTLVKFDVFGFEGRVPDASDVQSVTLGYRGYTYDDAAEINEIISLHKEIIEGKAENDAAVKAYSNNDTNYDITSVYVQYLMKSGGTLSRRYTIPVYPDGGDAAEEYFKLVNSPDAMYYNYFGNADISEPIEAWVDCYDEETGVSQQMNAENNDIQALLDAVLEDMEAGRIGEDAYYAYNSEYEAALLYNEVYFVFRSKEVSTEGDYVTVSVRIQKDSSSTIAVIKRLGLLSDEQLTSLQDYNTTKYQ